MPHQGEVMRRVLRMLPRPAADYGIRPEHIREMLGDVSSNVVHQTLCRAVKRKLAVRVDVASYKRAP